MNSVRDLFPYLPLSNRDSVPHHVCDDPIDRQDEALDTIIPTSSNIAYDMKEVIGRVNISEMVRFRFFFNSKV